MTFRIGRLRRKYKAVANTISSTKNIVTWLTPFKHTHDSPKISVF